MFSFIKNNFFTSHNQKTLNDYNKLLEKVNHEEEYVKKLNDSDLRNNTRKFKEMLKEGDTLENLLPKAFASVREASIRTLSQRHYDVQIIGGIALHHGKIAK